MGRSADTMRKLSKSEDGATTMGTASGGEVTEIKRFEISLQVQALKEAVSRQLHKKVPYHILFRQTYKGREQAWIGYKEAVASGRNTFKFSRYYHTN